MILKQKIFVTAEQRVRVRGLCYDYHESRTATRLQCRSRDRGTETEVMGSRHSLVALTFHDPLRGLPGALFPLPFILEFKCVSSPLSSSPFCLLVKV
jgi:hypothetical protein